MVEKVIEPWYTIFFIFLFHHSDVLGFGRCTEGAGVRTVDSASFYFPPPPQSSWPDRHIPVFPTALPL